MYDFDFDSEPNGLELSWRDTGGEIPRREARPVYAGEMDKLLGARTVKFMCVKCLAEFFGTEEHVLRAKIEELKDNNCPLFR